MKTVDNSASNAYNASMATITVRGLPEEIHTALRVRAARNGRSMEAEVREILAAATKEAEPRRTTVAELQAWVAERTRHLPPGYSAVDALIAERRSEFEREEEESRQCSPQPRPGRSDDSL
jgi:plasmid stability protein